MNVLDLDPCCRSCISIMTEATDRNDIVNNCEHVDECYELIKEVLEK